MPPLILSVFGQISGMGLGLQLRLLGTAASGVFFVLVPFTIPRDKSVSGLRPMAPTRFGSGRRPASRGLMGIHRSRASLGLGNITFNIVMAGLARPNVQTLKGRVGGIRQAFLEESAP